MVIMDVVGMDTKETPQLSGNSICLTHGLVFIWTSGMGGGNKKSDNTVDVVVGWHMGLIKTAHAFVKD